MTGGGFVTWGTCWGQPPDLGTWEGRMAGRAAERHRAEVARIEAERTAEQAAEDARIAAEQREEFAAGPPGGCATCWTWAPDYFSPTHSWWHVTREDVPDGLCHHECHGDEPVGCLPVPIG